MKYSVSILAHNNLALTRNCLTSIFAAGCRKDEAELLLTDNGSQDGTWAYFETLCAHHSHVRCFHNEHNLGFIKPNIAALQEAKGEFFVLLNNDCLVPRDWLETMADPFADPLVMLTGPSGNSSSLGNDFRGYRGPYLEYIEGSCLMGRTAFLKEFGLFDDRLIGAYGEDADLCLRVRQAGYKLASVPVNVRHLGGMTSAMVPEAAGWMQQNLSYLRNKWSPYLVTREFNDA